MPEPSLPPDRPARDPAARDPAGPDAAGRDRMVATRALGERDVQGEAFRAPPLFVFAAGAWRPDPLTRGPFAGMQGGAAAGLMAAAIEEAAFGDDPAVSGEALLGEALSGDVASAASGDGLAAGFLADATTHFLRPVPLAPLTIEIETLKTGRRVRVFDARLCAGGSVLAVQRATAIAPRRDGALPTPGVLAQGDPERWAPQTRAAPHRGAWMMDAMDCRADPSGKIWFRLKRPLTQKHGAMSAVSPVADWAHGLAPPLGAKASVRAAIPNTDVTIHLFRAPRGAWIALDAASAWSLEAIGVGWASLHDVGGLVGRVAMSVAVESLKDED